MPLFEMRGVDYVYPDGRGALEGVDLCIHRGDTVALVGQNGAGKTTLIKHLNGILRPTRGEVLFEGRPLSPEILPGVRRRIGMVFQDPDDQLFCPTVFDDVAFGPLHQGLSSRRVKERVAWALEVVGLRGCEEKPPHHLSYGQRKRAALATALAMDPEILILDEPTSNLDPRNERALREVLMGLECTLVVVSHDLPFLYGLCRRAVVLQRGRVHHDYTMEELVSQRAFLREHGLDFRFRCTCCDGEDPGDHDHTEETLLLLPPREEPPAVLHISSSWDRGGRRDPEDEPPAVEVKGYSYQYPDGTLALRGVDLTVKRGERVAVVGENGAGKSTLAKGICGVLLGKGRVRICGVEVAPKTLMEIRRRVGLVFQDPSDQLFCPTAREDVAFGPRHLGLEKAQIDARVSDALEAVEMTPCADRPTHHMSMGEKKRVAIASILAMGPEILVLDEPTAHLDPESAERIVSLLRRHSGTTIIISHDLPILYQLCSRVVVMREGRIVRDLPMEAFRQDQNLISRFGLDHTYKCSCCRKIRALQDEPGTAQDPLRPHA
jgi:cobalt transport protein ATP-binding subunit